MEAAFADLKDIFSAPAVAKEELKKARDAIAAEDKLPAAQKFLLTTFFGQLESFLDQMNKAEAGQEKGNPGRGGWGVILIFNKNKKELHGGEAATTNNRMELTAVIEGLAALKKRSRVRVFTDSQYVQKGISEWIHRWKKRGWRTADKKPVKNEDLWRRLDELAGGHSVEWQWIKGHAGHPENERADALANLGVERMAPHGG